MPRARILYVITDLNVGGTPLDVLRLATSLPRDRFRPLVVSLADVGPIGRRLQAAGVAVEACGARGVRDVRALWRLRRIIRAFRPDVVHSLLFHANIAVRIVGPMAGVPADRIVCSILTVETERHWHLRVENLTCRACRFVIGNSRSVVDHLHRAGRVPRSRLRWMPGGIDVDGVAGAAPLDRQALDIPAGIPIVLWVGRLDPVKGLDELVEAAVLLRRRTAAQFLLVGEGSYEAAVRQRVARAGAGECVRLLGRRDDVPSLLAAADVFVFPSRAEGLPNALIEAMAAAKAIVATDAPGCRDLIRHEQSGLLVPVGDPAALAAGVERLLRDADLRLRLGTAASAWARAHCDWTVIRRDWAALYERVASDAGRSGNQGTDQTPSERSNGATYVTLSR